MTFFYILIDHGKYYIQLPQVFTSSKPAKDFIDRYYKNYNYKLVVSQGTKITEYKKGVGLVDTNIIKLD